MNASISDWHSITIVSFIHTRSSSTSKCYYCTYRHLYTAFRPLRYHQFVRTVFTGTYRHPALWGERRELTVGQGSRVMGQMGQQIRPGHVGHGSVRWWVRWVTGHKMWPTVSCGKAYHPGVTLVSRRVVGLAGVLLGYVCMLIADLIVRRQCSHYTCSLCQSSASAEVLQWCWPRMRWPAVKMIVIFCGQNHQNSITPTLDQYWLTHIPVGRYFDTALNRSLADSIPPASRHLQCTSSSLLTRSSYYKKQAIERRDRSSTRSYN